MAESNKAKDPYGRIVAENENEFFCLYGMMQVDKANEPKTQDAPWIASLKETTDTSWKGKKEVYYSSDDINFNRVVVQETYLPHLFVWTKDAKGYARAFSPERMKENEKMGDSEEEFSISRGCFDGTKEFVALTAFYNDHTDNNQRKKVLKEMEEMISASSAEGAAENE